MRSPTSLLTRALLAFVLNSAVVDLAHGQPNSWRNVVIKGGGFVSGLAYHPTQPDLLYARTDVGGAFRWQPGTGAWVPLTDSLGRDDSQLTGVLSIGLDPRDANRVYLACGQYLPSWASPAAILSSTDQGSTWTRATLPLKLGGNSDGRSTGERLQVDPNQGAILLLGTNQNGLWKSTDHAQTWTKVTGFAPAGVTFVLFDPRSGTAGNATLTIYAGVDSTTSASLYRSTDAGATWAAVPGQPGGLLPHHAKLSEGGTLYVSYCDRLGPNDISTGAVWKLNTGNGTWTNITPPKGQGGFAGLALDRLHPGTLVVTTIDRWSPRDEIYRSTDDGASWKPLNALSVRDCSSAPYASTITPHWMGAVEIDPFNAGRAFFITGFGVFGTDNLTAADRGGQITWFFRNDGLEETVPLGLVSPPVGAPLVSVIGDIDGFRHDVLTVSPPGRHAPAVGTNVSIDFAELAPEQMVRTHGGGASRGSRSTDGGTTWTFFAATPAPATSGNAGAISLGADGTRIVWAPPSAGLYYSLNAGATWTASSGGPSAIANVSYTPTSDRVNPVKFYVYDGRVGQVLVSTNGGSSFSVAATGLPTGAEALRSVPANEGHLWLPAGSSGLYRSTDSGASFAKISNVQEGYRIGFGKPAPGRTYPAIYAWAKISGVVGLFRSDDNAVTWMRINDDAHQFGWINALTGDPRVYGRLYLATGGRGIVYGDLAHASPAITWSPLAPIRFGTALTASQLGASTAVPGVFTYDPPLGTVLPVGPHTLTATFTPADPVAYASATSQVSLTVLSPDDPAPSTRLVNIAARAYCATGNSVTIGGFVIGGGLPKRVLVRAVGPSLTAQGIGSSEVLLDPMVEVHQGERVIATNDNLADNPNAAEIVNVSAQIGASVLEAADLKSSALLLTLSPGVYSFVVRGQGLSSGIVLLEVYDADFASTESRFVNIATRARAATGNGVAIGGFVIAGNAPKQVLLRAVGPTLTTHGIAPSEVLLDPTIELHHGADPTVKNDNWVENANAAAITTTSARIGASPFDENDRTSSALLLSLPPGVYSFIASGKSGGSGIVLVEVYDAD